MTTNLDHVTKEQLAEEYAQSAAQLGDKKFKMHVMTLELEKLQTEALSLVEKMKALTVTNEALVRALAAPPKGITPDPNSNDDPTPCGAV